MSKRAQEPGEELTQEQLQVVIDEKLSNALDWLGRAYRVRPRDDESERTLLSVMAGLRKLKQDADKAFTDRARPSKSRVRS